MKVITGKEAFLLYQSYGFPIEMTIEEAAKQGMLVDVASFYDELEKHKQQSRKAAGFL